MKKRQIIIFGVFLLLSGLIFFRLMGNKKTKTSEVKEKSETIYVPISDVNNQVKVIQISAYGQINPNVELDVSFEVQGKLEMGSSRLKPGMKFSKNQLLYSVNKTEAFYTLNARKTQLANLIIGALPDVEIDYPKEKSKWMKFYESISTSDLMPKLPSFSSTKEQMFFTSRQITSEYYNIKSLEARMEKYYYLAPFDGTITEIYAEPGTLAGPGVRIAKITKTGDFEVKVPISMDNIHLFKAESQASFKNSAGKIVGKGKIIRISDVVNQKTQSIDVYYSIQKTSDEAIYNGMFLTVEIKRKSEVSSFTIPRMAMEEEKVQVLEKGKIIEREVQIVGRKPDSLFVTGLENGEKILLERSDATGKNQKIIGIKR